MKFRPLTAAILAFAALVPTYAPGWSMKTHVWVGQQVLREVQMNGKVTIAGREYPVPAHVAIALQSNPGNYLMGHLGPDAFPDAIVGQTTIHPGIDSGWPTDLWLRHLLKNASSAEEVAFSYGFAGHAAGDVFAHTYVNAYAGDIFLLTSQTSGREVERRHFVLEKYIDTKVPQTSLDDLKTATSFARDRLILDRDIFDQYGRVDTAHHLRAMFLVRDAVNNLDREHSKLVAQLTDWGAQFLKQQAKLAIDAASAKHLVELAQAGLDVESKALEVKQGAYDFAKNRLGEARDIVKRNPELITLNENLLIQQTKLAADAFAEATRIAAEVNKAIGDIQKRISNLRGQLGNLACELLLYPPAVKKCKEAAGNINEAISSAEQEISGQRERQRVADSTAREAAAARDRIKQTLDSLKQQLDTATRGLADTSYETAVAVADADIKLERELIVLKQKGLDEAKKVQAAIEKELGKLTPIIDELKKAVDRYNIVTLLIKNWLADIGTATEEYIKASHKAALLMAGGGGNPLDPYTDWYSCYGQVFVAVPKQVGQVACLAKEYVKNIQDSVNAAIDSLPEILRWLIFPTREATNQAMRKIKPELENAAIRIGSFLTNPTTVDFLLLLAKPENATREKLVSVFQEDNSRLKLIRFDDVASLVDRDLSLTDDILDPVKFAPLRHSVTLAKLALLGPAELNDVINDLAGTRTSGRYGSPIYPLGERNFSVMLDAVRSIDGNHQWQAYGLPYPRRLGVAHGSPLGSRYGYDYFQDHGKGLRIWADRYLREKVFLKIFNDPVIGVLGERPELRWPKYKFPACPANPFPATQSDGGEILSFDRQCVDSSDPSRPVADRPFANARDYERRYFSCDDPKSRVGFATIVSSHTYRGAAQRRAKTLADEFPDMHFEVHDPVPGSRFWAVMSSRCATIELSSDAREVAISRGIAQDAYLVKGGSQRIRSRHVAACYACVSSSTQRR